MSAPVSVADSNAADWHVNRHHNGDKINGLQIVLANLVPNRDVLLSMFGSGTVSPRLPKSFETSEV